VDGDAPDPGHIEKLIHLRVVGENDAVLSESAVITDVDHEAVTHVDTCRWRYEDVGADLHAERAKMLDASAVSYFPEAARAPRDHAVQPCLHSAAHTVVGAHLRSLLIEVNVAGGGRGVAMCVVDGASRDCVVSNVDTGGRSCAREATISR
jgi:hypothetical protein